MNFGANKTTVEVIKEGPFGGNFRDIYSDLIVNGRKNHGNNLTS